MSTIHCNDSAFHNTCGSANGAAARYVWDVGLAYETAMVRCLNHENGSDEDSPRVLFDSQGTALLVR